MVDSQTTSRAEALKTAGDLARASVENLVKEAVAEAMREVEAEQGSSSSNGGRVPAALLLLAIGALIGYALATRGESEMLETEEVGRPTEPEPPGQRAPGPEASGEAATTSGKSDEEPVDTTTDD